MLRKSLVPAVAMSLAFTAWAAPVQAKDHTARNVLLGITAAIGVATVAAIAAGAGKKACRGSRSSLSFCDRAVARCMNAAHRDNIRRGGGGVEYLKLRKAKRKSYGLKLYITLRSYEPWGAAYREIKCKVRRNLAIKSLVWLN